VFKLVPPLRSVLSLPVFTNVMTSSYFSHLAGSGINTRMGAQLLVQSCVFDSTKRAITSNDSNDTGYATVEDVSLGGSTDDAPKGNMSIASVPYKFTLLGSAKVKEAVVKTAGQTMTI
jgi:pectate lyase